MKWGKGKIQVGYQFILDNKTQEKVNNAYNYIFSKVLESLEKETIDKIE